MSWDIVKLGDIVKMVTGKTPPTNNSAYFEGEYIWVNPSDFRNKVILKSKRTVSEKAIQEKKCTILPNGTVLLSCIGDIGKVGILKTVGTTNQQITGLIPNNRVYSDYLYYYLIHNKSKLEALANKAVVAILNNERLKELEVVLPPLETQKRIADILDVADALRQKDQELLKKYDDLAQAIFIEMFGDPVKNEKGWEKAPIGSITRVGSGGTPSRQIPEYFSGTIPWVKTTEVNGSIIYSTEENITEEALANSSCKVYPKDSIIIAMYGQGKTRGQVGILGVPSSTNQACGVISPSKRIIPEFLLQYLKMSYQDLRNLGRGGNQENLNKGMIENFLIIIPPISLQIKFKETIENIISQVNELKHNESSILFNSLINNAFNGQLVA